MKIEQLVATNFMPYRETATIDFPQDDFCNVMIVLGDNMRGKTSLLNAIRWALYGKALGRHSHLIPLPDLVNSDGAKVDDWRIDVFLKFNADGVKYELRRTANRRPLVSNPTRPDDFIVSVHLTKNGSLVPGDQVEGEINQIAPEPVARFFLFDGELLGEYEELLIQGSEQGRKIKDSIEQVLGVPALTNGRAELGVLLKSAMKKQSQEMAHIRGLEQAAQRMDELSTQLESQENDLRNLEAQLAQTRDERTALDDELEKAAEALALQANLDAARNNAKSLGEELKRKRTDRQALLASAWKDMLDAKLGVKRSLLLEKQQQITGTLRERSMLEQEVSSIRKLLDERDCPTCLRPYPDDDRSALGQKLGTAEEALKLIGQPESDLHSIAAELAQLDDIRGANVRDRIADVDRDIRNAEVGLQKAENDIERIEELIAGKDTAELARKRVRHSEMLKEEGRLDSSIKDARRDIEDTNAELAVSLKSMESLAGARSKRSTIKAGLLSNLEACFRASVERLRDNLRQSVEELATESFKEMTTQKKYRGLEINDNYGLSIIDSGGRKVSVRSAGAEQIVALALIDGLNRTGRAIGPVVMDTPFGRLDPNHRDNILRYFPTVTSQFVVLVHRGEIRPETDLAPIKARIGASYVIREISETQSKIEKVAL